MLDAARIPGDFEVERSQVLQVPGVPNSFPQIGRWQYLTTLFNINAYTGQVSVLSTRKSKGTSADAKLDSVFHALGDRTRRALLAKLSRGPAMVTELAGPFQMSLPAVSRHIRVLEKARLVSRSIDGRVHRCSLRAEPLAQVQHWLNRYRPFWEGTLDSLASYVEHSKAE